MAVPYARMGLTKSATPQALIERMNDIKSGKMRMKRMSYKRTRMKSSSMKCKKCGMAHKTSSCTCKMKTKGKNWIAGAIKHPGALHRQLGVKAGKKIPASKLAKAAKKGGVLGRRARLAETLKGFH
jgi:hypothetical protein